MPEHSIVRLLAEEQRLWLAAFPGRHRRAEWHIIHHLGAAGRDGTSVGEIYGLVRQIFLLDDATVRDRILSLVQAGLCRLDGPEATPSARTILLPSPALLAAFDRHVAAFGAALHEAAARLDPALPTSPPPPSAPLHREALRFFALQDEHWRAGLTGFFDGRALSQARRLEARRQLLSTSHATLVRLALDHHYATGAGAEGVLADRMAAHLLELVDQNFQTTRDHLGYLMALGVLERRAGKALHVGLAGAAVGPLHQALGRTAAALPGLARGMAGASPPWGDAPVPGGDETVNLRPADRARAMHVLAIVEPEEARRAMPIPAGTLSIGRAPSCDVVLADPNISRLHCRIEREADAVTVLDLGSTNGSFVGGHRVAAPVRLADGDRLQVGRYVLEYRHPALADTDWAWGGGRP